MSVVTHAEAVLMSLDNAVVTSELGVVTSLVMAFVKIVVWSSTVAWLVIDSQELPEVPEYY